MSRFDEKMLQFKRKSPVLFTITLIFMALLIILILSRIFSFILYFLPIIFFVLGLINTITMLKVFFSFEKTKGKITGFKNTSSYQSITYAYKYEFIDLDNNTKSNISNFSSSKSLMRLQVGDPVEVFFNPKFSEISFIFPFRSAIFYLIFFLLGLISGYFFYNQIIEGIFTFGRELI